jgi:hypothetical protein
MSTSQCSLCCLNWQHKAGARAWNCKLVARSSLVCSFVSTWSEESLSWGKILDITNTLTYLKNYLYKIIIFKRLCVLTATYLPMRLSYRMLFISWNFYAFSPKILYPSIPWLLINWSFNSSFHFFSLWFHYMCILMFYLVISF